MRARCERPKTRSYVHYGGRGIFVCEEWRQDAGAFVRWAMANGWAVGLQIDRIDNDGPYTPANCRFVPAKVNAANKRAYRHPVNPDLPPGVVPHKRRFKAHIRVGARTRHLGVFATPEEAGAAFARAKLQADRTPAQSASVGSE